MDQTPIFSWLRRRIGRHDVGPPESTGGEHQGCQIAASLRRLVLLHQLVNRRRIFEPLVPSSSRLHENVNEFVLAPGGEGFAREERCQREGTASKLVSFDGQIDVLTRLIAEHDVEICPNNLVQELWNVIAG